MWYKLLFLYSFTSPPNVRLGPRPFLHLTKELNVHHKETSDDLINVIKNGLELFFKTVLI